MAWPMQGRTLGENSNYALVRSLSSGTAQIDRTRFEVGDLPAGDFRTYDGHVYSDKAPGLALVTVPAYVTLRALGMRTSGDPTRALWALRLWSAVLPAVLLLVLTYTLAERLAPGSGGITAFALGAGTLILPLATMFYSHVLTATLVLVAFALLCFERDGAPRAALVAAAGAVVGFAFAGEYPVAMCIAALGAYAVARGPCLARLGAYALGVAIGVAPLLAYNQWAFGSLTHLSYFGDELSSGTLGGKLQPSLLNVLFTFFALPGMFVLTPLFVCTLVGLVYLYRRGARTEALLIAALLAAFTLYNASLPGLEYDAFTAGPRYLIPIVPLLVLPLALTFRVWPATTVALCVVSVALMAVLTGSHVHSGVDPRWFHELRLRAFPETAVSLIGITGWYAILPFFAAIAVAFALALLAASRRLTVSDPFVAGVAVVAWAAAAAVAPNELSGDAGRYRSYLVPVLIFSGLVALLVFTPHARLLRRGAGPALSSGRPRARRRSR